MGAEENKQVVKDLYAAFGRRDIAAVAPLVAKDVKRREQRRRFLSRT